jgi:hypothetical protein
MVLTCLQCGAQRSERECAAPMNARVERACEGRCKQVTKHIAGLPREHVHLTTVPVVGTRMMKGARPARSPVALPSF